MNEIHLGLQPACLTSGESSCLVILRLLLPQSFFPSLHLALVIVVAALHYFPFFLIAFGNWRYKGCTVGYSFPSLLTRLNCSSCYCCTFLRSDIRHYSVVPSIPAYVLNFVLPSYRMGQYRVCIPLSIICSASSIRRRRRRRLISL